LSMSTYDVKQPGIEAAKQFVSNHFPNCDVAILTGSATRGEETPYSDLDILVISDDDPSAYVEAFHEYGWMIEILVHRGIHPDKIKLVTHLPQRTLRDYRERQMESSKGGFE
jgi:predicted nucleotidyltransferase